MRSLSMVNPSRPSVTEQPVLAPPVELDVRDHRFSDLPGVWADQVRRVALEHSEARITEAILRDGQVSAGSRRDERCPGSRGADDVNRPRRVGHVRRAMPRE
jgi:hypothetical protein